jgi:dipeptidyl aminopeptidase/acylaminoacyl peptidase
MKTRLALFVLTLAALSAAEKWTVDDLLLREQASDPVLSPDGRLAAYTRGKMDKEKGENVSLLYLKATADGSEEIQLTRGQDSASAPRFSPDSRRLAFLTAKKPNEKAEQTGRQVWLLDTRGGEPWAVTKLPKGVVGFGWIDNDTLLVAAPEEPTLHDQQVKELKDTSQVIDDEAHATPVRLFKVEVKGGKATRLTMNADRITSLTVSPDGKWAITNHNRSLREIFDQKIKPVTFLTDVATGKSEQLFAGQKLYPRGVSWTPDSKGFYFTAPYTTHPDLLNATINLAYWFEVDGRKLTKVELGWDNGLAAGVDAMPDGFLGLLANGARNIPVRYMRNGGAWTRQDLQGEQVPHLHALVPSADGKTLLYEYSTASVPPVWMASQVEGNRIASQKVFIECNSGWKKKPLAKTELVYWQGALDEKVEGILYYPHDYQAGRKYPLVVMIHGGPHGHDADYFTDRWGYPHQLIAQRGAFSFKPNYHGSSNYGLKWGESISNGKYNDLEWVDVEKGVDSLIAKGLIDKDKLGVMGWSNGSIITIELTTRTNRYKAAGAGAGDVNWTSDWGNAVFGDSFERYYLGKTPMEDPALYIRKSPLFRMDKVTTPTIIFFGTEDKQVPTEQGWQHFRALQHYGKADVKFILFPGEEHGPRKYVHQRRKVEEELAWFDKYLFQTLKDQNEALKKGSALAAALQLQNAGDAPPAADRGGFVLSRFEVTREQFKAFDPSYSFVPGTENHPATGISFDQAKGYAGWLAKRTGQPWRLPKEEEVAAMMKASAKENTLDYWAGYALNPEDAARLDSLVSSLKPDMLLRPVGSFTGAGDDAAYDLGGNAAEWVVDKDGKGKVLGGSADQPVNAMGESKARPAFVGFRVAR